MKSFQIENKASGVILGVYESSSKEGALDAMARDAGYPDYAKVCELVPDTCCEIVATEV